MSGPGLRGGDELPIGRRMARWRVRRRMTQQMLADRLGKSKSWVDKVERGVRALDRYSVIQEIAEVLHVDPSTLLGSHRVPRTAAVGLDGVEAVRAALARYQHRPTATPPVDQLHRHVAHAWLTYHHAHYAQLLRSLPALLDATHTTPALLVPSYRITAAVLVKLGEPDLAWLAADRAVTAAADHTTLRGTATIVVAQALRALDRDRLAMTAALTAADTVTDKGVQGTLLLQAGLAAAGTGDRRNTDDLIDHADDLTNRGTPGHDPHHTHFGPLTVRLARVLAALRLGDTTEAVYLHEKAVRHDDWTRLPAELRAAHLLDAAHAYAQTGDHTTAAQKVLTADTLAPTEVRFRPYARTVIAEIARSGPAGADVARLATAVGLTR
ncbi:helix-turn-helix domain-containing protein [Micromonospora sp. SH-82]|uniref:helix-turn-helix domain-containing protein n=1 Tax=Micromonospora sp. SH-82 TaxID=3132938 RepID=UPI003EC0EE30